MKTLFKSQHPPERDEIPSLIFSRLGKGHEVSFYYSLLLKNISSTSALKNTWEHDLKCPITDKQWSDILCNIKNMSRNISTRLTQFKIINRLYWTPSKMYRLKLKDNPSCWKCAKNGTIIHMLWHCTKVQDFWNAIHESVVSIVKFKIPFCAQLFVLGDLSNLRGLISNDCIDFVQTALMVCRKLLAQQWKSKFTPTISDWYNSLSTVAAFEQISLLQLDRGEKHKLKWEKFLQHIHRNER